MAVLEVIADIKPTLIGAEGAKTPAGGRGRGDRTGALRRGGSPNRPRGAAHLERKSTTKLKEPKK